MAKYRCDIIVVTWNGLEYIKGCVNSVLACTGVKSRLIIVDNASRDDTREYLRGLKGNDNVDIEVKFNSENAGPGKARNIALGDIQADFVCFLDSDTTVTPGWLSVMIDLAGNNREIGMINPSSNNFNQVPPECMPLNDYAASLFGYKDKYLEVGHCISFCMLIKKEVIEKIGFIDEGYVLALYEDTDYSMTAARAGYRCVIARGSYVWHHGHGSTGKVRKINAIAEKNKERFYKKWGRPLRILQVVSRETKNGEFKNALSSSIQLARDGNYMYLFIKGEDPSARLNIFEQSGLAEHANVHLKFCGDKNFIWSSLWQVLIKRKKSYDLIISDDERVASLLMKFAPLYKAAVLLRPGAQDLARIVRGLKSQ